MVYQEEMERMINKAYKEVVKETGLLPSPYKILNHIKYNNYDLIFGENIVNNLNTENITIILDEKKHAYRDGGVTKCDSQVLFTFFRKE